MDATATETTHATEFTCVHVPLALDFGLQATGRNTKQKKPCAACSGHKEWHREKKTGETVKGIANKKSSKGSSVEGSL